MALKDCKFGAGGGADPASQWTRGYEAGSWCGRWVQWEGQARGSDPTAHMEKADDCYSSGCSRSALMSGQGVGLKGDPGSDGSHPGLLKWAR